MRELLHAARTPVQDYRGPELVAERKSVLVGTAQPFMETDLSRDEMLSGERSDLAPVTLGHVKVNEQIEVGFEVKQDGGLYDRWCRSNPTGEAALLLPVLSSFPDNTGGSL